MKKSANLIVIALAAVCLVVAIQMSSKQQTARESFKPLKPFEKVDLNAVSQVRIAGGPEPIVINKVNKNEWGLESRKNYPVDPERLRRSVFGMTHLEAVEKLTADPAKYDQLGVGKKPEKGSVELAGDDKKTIAKLIIGKVRSAGPGADGYREGTYVRTDDNPAVFISDKTLMVDQTPSMWLKHEVVKVDDANLQRVRIDNKATTQSIEMAREKTDPFKLVTKIPKGRQEKADALSPASRALAELTLTDVLAADALGTRTLTHEATWRATQKNGLVYKADASDMDGKKYVRLSAEYDKAADLSLSDARTSDTLAAKALPPAEAEAKKINAAHAPWIYELPPFEYENFTKKLDDVTEPIKKEEPTPAATPAKPSAGAFRKPAIKPKG